MSHMRQVKTLCGPFHLMRGTLLHPNAIGQWIYQERHSFDPVLPRSRLANLAGIDKNEIHRIEIGKVKLFRYETVWRLQKTFKTLRRQAQAIQKSMVEEGICDGEPV